VSAQEEALTSVALWDHSAYFENFEIGRVFEHHWGRTLNHGDNSLFSTATVTWLPLHLNRDYAESQGHPDTPLNPMLVFCTVFGLSVQDLSESHIGGAFLGVDDLKFLRPVYPGQTLTARSTVISKRDSSSRPKEGIVTWQTEGFDGSGDKVIAFLRTNLIGRREAKK
jgi:acyl dehydratase